MNATQSLIPSVWNFVIIVYLLFIILIFYIEIQNMKLSKDKVNTRYLYQYIENWRRLNHEYYTHLVKLDLIGVRRSVSIIHLDFKKLLEIKFNTQINKYENTISENRVYLPYITNSELKEFMRDPYLWLRPHYTDVHRYFDKFSHFKGIIGSNKLFPHFRNLEQMILEEVGFDLNFKNDLIDKNYMLMLQKRILKTKNTLVIGFSLLNIFICLIMFLSNVRIQDILIISAIGFFLIYLYNRFW